MTDSELEFTPRDVLAGHLAAVIPALPQEALEAAAEGLTAEATAGQTMRRHWRC